METKTCTKCHGAFSLDRFYARKDGKHSAACKKCHVAGVRASQKKRKERQFWSSVEISVGTETLVGAIK